MLTKEEFGLSEFYPEYFPHLDNLGTLQKPIVMDAENL